MGIILRPFFIGGYMDLTAMDWVRAAIANAYHSGLTLDDLQRMAEYSDMPQDFDRAVNMLATATPIEEIT